MDNSGNVFWKRQDETSTLLILDKTLDEKDTLSHRCVFWDFNDLLKQKKKDIAFVYAITLFEIFDDNFLDGEIHNLRKKSSIKSKLQDIFGKCNYQLLSQRLIRFEGIPLLKNENDQQLEKIFMLYFVESRGLESKLLHCVLDNTTNKCKEVNQEIDNLTSSRTLHSNKFRQHLSTLLLFQEIEHKNLSKQFSQGDVQVKSVKMMSKRLLKLREIHSIELKMLQSFQESFKEITNTNLRWLLSKNGDLSLLEKIEKAQICQICESALSFFMKVIVVPPDQKPEIVETKRKAIISRDNCLRNLTPPQEDQIPPPITEKRVQVKMNLNENISDRKKIPQQL